jgi:hypothetical protein
MLKNFILLLSLVYFSAPAFGAASSQKTVKEIYVNVGNHTEFYNAVQTDGSGSLRKFDFAPTLGVGFTIPLWDTQTWSAIPEFNWVLPQLIEDSNVMINTFMYRFDMGYLAQEWLRLRIGTGLMHMNQQGKGGKTRERNGNGESTFYYADSNRSSLNNTLDLGAEFLYQQWAMRLQTYTYSIFKEDRRQVSYSLFVTYYWER